MIDACRIRHWWGGQMSPKSVLIAGLAACLLPVAASAGTLASATLVSGQLSLQTGGGGLVASGTASAGTAVAVRLSVPALTQTRSPTGFQTVARISGLQSLVWSTGSGARVDRGIGQVSRVYRTSPLPSGLLVASWVRSLGVSTVSFPGAIGSTRQYRWQTGLFTHVSTFDGSPLGTFTAVGSNGLTPGGGGTLTLVAPVVIRRIAQASGPGGYSVGGAATLTLNFVPELGTLPLLALVATGLALKRR